MNRIEAEDFVYKSYLKAEKYQKYEDKDSEKRNPGLSKDVLWNMCTTPSVVITGSKGKGSVANMISQILQTQIKVGLLTSPHIIDFCERFKVNGIDISDSDFVRHMESIAPIFEEIDKNIPSNVCISPMAIQAALGLSYFNEQQTDFNILECGKGAKYDDVNNVKHDYAVINSIFLEHTRELGDTVEKIALDKSHVITGDQKCVYVAEQKPEVINVIKERAKSYNTAIKIYGEDFWAQNIQFTNAGMMFDVVIGNTIYRDIIVPLLGEHQAKNCALALALAKDVLQELNITDVKNSLLKLDWPGRMEVLNQDPFILLDACINRESCENVKKVINHLNLGKGTIIIGIPDDKDYLGVAMAMSEVSNRTILTKSQNPHYKFSEEQKAVVEKQGYKADWVPNLYKALKIAIDRNEPIVILGTTSVVAEVKKIQRNNWSQEM